MSDDVEVSVREHDGAVVVRIDGEIDLASAADVEERVLATARLAAAVVVDLSAATYLDSAGLRMLDHVVAAVEGRQATVRIVVPDGARIRYVLELVRFREELLCGSVEDAVEAVLRPLAGGA